MSEHPIFRPTPQSGLHFCGDVHDLRGLCGGALMHQYVVNRDGVEYTLTTLGEKIAETPVEVPE